MESIKVDVSNPDLFKPPEFKVLPPGIHLFAVSELTGPAPAKEGPNLVIKCDFRCQDEDDNKGLAVFENLVIVTETPNAKAVTARDLNQRRMVQLCLACGVTTQQQIEETGELPIMQCAGQFFKAQTGVRTKKYQGEDQTKAYIKKYLVAEEAPVTE
jgi:hypothetical protein